MSNPYETAFSYVANRPGVLIDPSGMCWGPERICGIASGIKDTVVTGVKIQAGLVYGTAQEAANTAEGLYRVGNTHLPTTPSTHSMPCNTRATTSTRAAEAASTV